MHMILSIDDIIRNHPLPSVLPIQLSAVSLSHASCILPAQSSVLSEFSEASIAELTSFPSPQGPRVAYSKENNGYRNGKTPRGQDNRFNRSVFWNWQKHRSQRSLDFQ